MWKNATTWAKASLQKLGEASTNTDPKNLVSTQWQIQSKNQ
jgi:hypothetical protein